MSTSAATEIVEETIDTIDRAYDEGYEHTHDVVPLTKASSSVVIDINSGFDEIHHGGVSLGLLSQLYDVSGALQTCVQAYIANLEQMGHVLRPTVPLESETAADLVAQAMYEDEVMGQDLNDDLEDDDGVEPPRPDSEEVLGMLRRVRNRTVRERLRLGRFIKSCGGNETWSRLRELRRLDLERYGNAYWEVVREDVPIDQLEVDDEGNVMRLPLPRMLARVNPREVTLTSYGSEVVVYRAVPISLVTVERQPFVLRFRRYKQTVTKAGVAATRWFKAYRDPRLMSASSGKYYDSVESMQRAEQGARPATELVHFLLGEGPYGQPRWYGEIQTALGLRKSQETNLHLLNRGGIPGLAIVVEGGGLKDDCAKELKNHAEQNMNDPASMQKIMTIETEGSENTRVRIEKLNGHQTDGLFLKYIELDYDLIGQAFRLPKLLRGDSSDMNRATADASLTFAESQVFVPERRAFDEWMTSFFLNDLDCRFVEFSSKPATLPDAEARGERIDSAVKAGWLMVNDARKLGGEVFDTELPSLNADWAKQPIAVTLAGIAAVDDPSLDDYTDPDETPAGEETIAAAASAALASLRGPRS